MSTKATSALSSTCPRRGTVRNPSITPIARSTSGQRLLRACATRLNTAHSVLTPRLCQRNDRAAQSRRTQLLKRLCAVPVSTWGPWCRVVLQLLKRLHMTPHGGTGRFPVMVVPMVRSRRWPRTLAVPPPRVLLACRWCAPDRPQFYLSRERHPKVWRL